MYVFLIWQLKTKQSDENVGHFVNMRRAGQGVKMLYGTTTQSGTGGHPRRPISRLKYQINWRLFVSKSCEMGPHP